MKSQTSKESWAVNIACTESRAFSFVYLVQSVSEYFTKVAEGSRETIIWSEYLRLVELESFLISEIK